MHSFRLAPLAVAAALAALPADAATKSELDALFSAIGTPRLLELMREEGLVQAAELKDSMFPGRGGWQPIASAIYATDKMEATFRDAFDAELADDDVVPLLDFFGSELGTRIVALELSAREAFLDPDVEDAASEAFAAQGGDASDRGALVAGFIDENDLIDLNVAGALNASLAFYSGLADGGGFELSQEDMLRDIWASEPDIRADTIDWAFSYLWLAYEPLSNDELQTYIALTASEAGGDLNRALFAAFDAVFDEISYNLGFAASRFATGEDI